MADITISDLELAPALTDDMVLPVENTTDTYAATLAMLRRLINKTFVEVENADFNALTDDGFYQCTGTPTNSPVAGAINWTLQVSAENGVVVQRAFSLDDNFANLYIRRWNGVTWTAWLDVGKGALDNKANVSLNNINATGQAKFDAKANADASNFNAAGKSLLSGLGMPSSRYTNLTLLASGNTYTAPANGYFCFYASYLSGADAQVYMQNTSTPVHMMGMSHFWYSSKGSARLFCPVKKGQACKITYVGTLQNINLYFIYAEGDQ